MRGEIGINSAAQVCGLRTLGDRVNESLKTVELIGRGAIDGTPDGELLERQPKVQQILQPRFAERGDECALVGDEVDDALTRELGEGLSDRAAAYAELGCQRELVEPLPRFDRALRDALAQNGGDTFGGRGSLELSWLGCLAHGLSIVDNHP